MVVHVEQKGVLLELAAEASEDQDVLAVPLDGAAALAFGEDSALDFTDCFPGVLLVVIVELNAVDILLGLVLDSAEDVDESVAELAGTVVVSTSH